MSRSVATELEILSDVISPLEGTLSPDVACAILQWKFSTKQIERMNRLGERNRNGAITPDEREELERFIRVGGLINLVQAKARVSLQQANAD